MAKTFIASFERIDNPLYYETASVMLPSQKLIVSAAGRRQVKTQLSWYNGNFTAKKISSFNDKLISSEVACLVWSSRHLQLPSSCVLYLSFSSLFCCLFDKKILPPSRPRFQPQCQQARRHSFWLHSKIAHSSFWHWC